MKGAIQKPPRSDGLLQTLLTHSADLAEIENTLSLAGNAFLIVLFLQKAFASDRGGDCTAAFLRPLHRISCVFSHIHI